ncbi:MAG: hypothetical protein A2167_03785 [Planctomycetes bacterium RBG_13_46_10]|nr:MAG: hypothetical protein A2167_03785 [Planctomycetes bacterium RBG_13_46_10]
MKRISVFTVAVLMLSPGITSAITYRYCIPDRFRVRYSPYAYSSTNTSGLISGELEYSAYAYSFKNPSGLVPYYYRYSPYAFTHRNPSGLIPHYYRYSPYAYSTQNPSGLVSEYYTYRYIPRYYYHGSYNCESSNKYESPNRSNNTGCYYGQTAYIGERTTRTSDYIKKMSALREKDGMQIIYNYLRNNNINNFEMDRLFKVDNKTVSVTFIFRDKNIIIKYWNPEEIQSLQQQTDYKKTYYEQYKQQWTDFCRKHEENGVKIYQIESADKEEILSKLSLYQELAEG